MRSKIDSCLHISENLSRITMFDFSNTFTPYGLSLILVCFTGLIFWYRRHNKRIENIPPLKGFSSSYKNARIVTAVEGAAGLFFVSDICKKLEQELCGVGASDLLSGVVFQFKLPFQGLYFYCSDYKVARAILEGDTALGAPESEKSPIQQQFDLFPGRHTMFRWVNYLNLNKPIHYKSSLLFL